MASPVTAFYYKKKLKFDTDTIGVDTNQTNFPVCVHINTSSWVTEAERTAFFGAWNVGGKRCQFFDADGTTNLDYEVDLYNSGTPEAIYWAKVPTVTGNSTADYIWVAFGNDPNGSAQDNPTGVWNSNFKMVHHLADATTSTVTDSVGLNNGAKLSANNPIEATGLVSKGQDFSTDYIKKDSPSFIDDTQGTIECLVKLDTLTTQQHLLGVCVSGATDDEYLLWFRGDSVKELQVAYILNAELPWTALTAANAINDNNWHHLALTSNASTVILYLDGSPITLTDAVGTNSGQWLASATQANVFSMGALLRATPILYFDGMLDEVRYSDDDRTADWIKLTYYSIKKTNFKGDSWISWDAAIASFQPWAIII